MLAINSRIKYIRNDTDADKATGMYPPTGTYGTIVETGGKCYKVKWDKGTYQGEWWCSHSDVELIYHPSINGAVEAIRIFMDEEGITPMAELVFAYGGSATICWVDINERENYMSGINGYTYIYDERPKRDFSKWIKTK